LKGLNLRRGTKLGKSFKDGIIPIFT